MKKLTESLFVIFIVVMLVQGCENGAKRVRVQTNYGDFTIELLEQTPIHSGNFIELVEKDFYDGLLFHRVIESFMIQGGDPESKGATPQKRLGGGGPGYLLNAEIGAPHIAGAVAAARTNNPQKKSSGSQFYIVTGNTVNDALLDKMERDKNIKYSDAQRQLYKKRGGTPHLDNDYTVFGRIVEGYDVVEKISKVETGQANRPVKNVVINNISILN